eukprot:5519426-Pleurochrysis_carterae.AAC.3
MQLQCRCSVHTEEGCDAVVHPSDLVGRARPRGAGESCCAMPPSAVSAPTDPPLDSDSEMEAAMHKRLVKEIKDGVPVLRASCSNSTIESSPARLSQRFGLPHVQNAAGSSACFLPVQQIKHFCIHVRAQQLFSKGCRIPTVISMVRLNVSKWHSLKAMHDKISSEGLHARDMCVECLAFSGRGQEGWLTKHSRGGMPNWNRRCTPCHAPVCDAWNRADATRLTAVPIRGSAALLTAVYLHVDSSLVAVDA